MEPVVDTDGPAEVAAVEAPFLDALNVGRPNPGGLTFAGLGEGHRFAVWAKQASLLAAAGVRPSSSHVFDDEGVPQVSSRGAFTDVADLTGDGPLVLYGVEVSPDDLLLGSFAAGFDWVAVVNQTSGPACYSVFVVGIVLEIRATRRADVAVLGGFGHSSAGGDCLVRGRVRLSDLAAFWQMVDRFGLSAETVYDRLEEGSVPLDASCAPVLSDTPVPPAAEMFTGPDVGSNDPLSPLVDVCGSLGLAGRVGVWILGRNCGHRLPTDRPI